MPGGYVPGGNMPGGEYMLGVNVPGGCMSGGGGYVPGEYRAEACVEGWVVCSFLR